MQLAVRLLDYIESVGGDYQLPAETLARFLNGDVFDEADDKPMRELRDKLDGFLAQRIRRFRFVRVNHEGGVLDATHVAVARFKPEAYRELEVAKVLHRLIEARDRARASILEVAVVERLRARMWAGMVPDDGEGEADGDAPDQDPDASEPAQE
ncbi:hypothetical protein ORIO_08545 [Cereibacter azotoformans]|uniref:hypothetical protein n=1 Tax=Cereibacter azotoformans TaxID=43057 RepID=UPI0005C4E30F|nr:hypothetical protein [Cereibacter azotoformans]ULB09956.1 hypothetical protein ORIO_08545 [Cereibacter azotoformans]